MKYSIIISAIILMSACSRHEIFIEVGNPCGFGRYGDIVAVDAKKIVRRLDNNFIVKDSEGNEVPYQITYDSLLIFQADVDANSMSKYTIERGLPNKVDTVATAIFRSDCQDDLAWENDRGGYRLYGPSFRTGGGRVYGYDIWTKSVPYPILSKRYDDDHKRGISYHVDHGDGFDGYTVGPTLGAGMNALIGLDGNICYPCAYKSYELLDNGPLRMTVRFIVDSIKIDSNYVVETRTVTLNAGSWLNKTMTEYTHIESMRQVVSGIVIHVDNCNYTLDNTFNYISYADQTDNIDAGNGEIYVGVLAESADSLVYNSFEKTVANAVGEVLLYNTYQPRDIYTYYWGSSWSKGGVQNLSEWNSILQNEAIKLRLPFKITIK